MTPDDELRAAAARAAVALRQIPGVTGVGIGPKRTGGVATGQGAILVFVNRKRPLSELSMAETIPTEAEGYPTDVAVMTNIRYAAEDHGMLVQPYGVLRPPPIDEFTPAQEAVKVLIGGGPISGRVDSSARGTIGVFLRNPSDESKIYALTCFHVLCKIIVGIDADGDPFDKEIKERPKAGTTLVGQVDPDGSCSCSHCCNDCFGTFVGGELVGDHTWQDFALVQLKAGTKYHAGVVEIGPLSGKATTPSVEDMGEHRYHVSKYGNFTKLSGGVVVAEVNGSFIVAPHSRAKTRYRDLHFGLPGDSGCAVVAAGGKVLGIAHSTFTGHAGDYFPGAPYPVHLMRVAPIQKILDRLNAAVPAGLGFQVELVIATSSTDIRTVPPAPHLTALLDDDVVTVQAPMSAPPIEEVDLPALGRQARADLESSTFGRWVFERWQRHNPELHLLVNHDRRVMTTWHRSGASAVFQRLARPQELVGAAMPSTVNGAPLSECIDRMHTVLSNQGSAELRADLQLLRARLPDLAGLTYQQILAAFDGVRY